MTVQHRLSGPAILTFSFYLHEDETDWFPATVNPAHPGLYKRRPGSDPANAFFAWWDGEHWYAYAGKASLAVQNASRGIKTSNHTAQWCGLKRRY